MQLSSLFQLTNSLALAGWVWLTIWQFLPSILRQQTRWLGLLLPLLLSILYAATILVHFTAASGGFDTLENVMALFDHPGVTLAGWVHYLAFDLFVGWCIANDAFRHTVNRFVVIPCFLCTFLFGPIGLILYAAIRLSLHLTRTVRIVRVIAGHRGFALITSIGAVNQMYYRLDGSNLTLLFSPYSCDCLLVSLLLMAIFSR